MDRPADAEYREVIWLVVMAEWPAAGVGQGGNPVAWCHGRTG